MCNVGMAMARRYLTVEVRQRAALELEGRGGAGAELTPFLAVVVIEGEIQNRHGA